MSAALTPANQHCHGSFVAYLHPSDTRLHGFGICAGLGHDQAAGRAHTPVWRGSQCSRGACSPCPLGATPHAPACGRGVCARLVPGMQGAAGLGRLRSCHPGGGGDRLGPLEHGPTLPGAHLLMSACARSLMWVPHLSSKRRRLCVIALASFSCVLLQPALCLMVGKLPYCPVGRPGRQLA